MRGDGRRPLVAGNWKMHTTVDEARDLAAALIPGIGPVTSVDRVVCPPFVSLAAVAATLRGTGIEVGAQTMSWREQGAFTGEISPLMLKPLVRWVILGHSERRQLFGVTDADVARAAAAALAHDLSPIVCVGETLAQRDAGETEPFVAGQVRAALGGLRSLGGLVIAYEPIWAIGTGRAATPDDANRITAVIRRTIADIAGDEAARATRILYGGSVTGANAGGFFAQPEIDGALVGGASLKPDDFAAIVQAAG